MKNYLILLCFAFLILVAWSAGYYIKVSTVHSIKSSSNADMEWLQKKFKLTSAQFEKIQRLHENYRPMCDSMCDRVRESELKLNNLISTNREMTPELKKAIQENSVLREVCQNALLEHVYLVSREMNPEQAKEYISMMQPHILKMGDVASKVR